MLNVFRIVNKQSSSSDKDFLVSKLQDRGFVEGLLEEMHNFDSRTDHYGSRIQSFAEQIEAKRLVGKLRTLEHKLHQLQVKINDYNGDFDYDADIDRLTITERPVMGS